VLRNLIVDLERPFDGAPPAGVEIAAADERALAWIDDVFGGWWSGEANAGTTLVARRDGAPLGFATFDAAEMHFAWLQGLARDPEIGIFGPFGVAPNARGAGIGRALLAQALERLRERGYARALIPAVGEERLARYYAAAAGAREVERFPRASLYRAQRRVLVMASGSGSNFEAVLDASRRGALPVEIAALIVNDANAYVIERAHAQEFNSTAVVAWDRARESRAEYDARLLAVAKAARPDLVLLLGWMHLLSTAFVDSFPHIANLHPAFLPLDPSRDDVVMPDGSCIPAFRGAHAVQDALAAGSPWVGATMHRVTPATDRGPVLARRPLRVEADEVQEHLMPRVHALERGVVASAVMRWLYERS
jgi:phosphoribosylglycinamide formyltransferase 1